MTAEDLRLYGITDSRLSGDRPMALAVKEALENGVTFLQYREKELPPAEHKQLALEVLKVCRAYGVPFIMNDDVELALELDADGVHVGQQDMDVRKARKILGKDRIIGVSARTVEQALTAERGGADYLGVGDVFGTSTKPDARKISMQVLREICAAVSVPVVAIGGITYDNVDELEGTGISGAAVIRAVFGQEDIGAAVKALKGKIQRICRG